MGRGQQRYIKKQKEIINNKNKQIILLKNKVKKENTSYKKYKNLYDNKNNEVNILKSKVNNKNNKINSLRNKLSSKNTLYNKYKTDYNSQVELNNYYKQEYIDQENEINDYINQVNSLENKINNLKNDPRIIEQENKIEMLRKNVDAEIALKNKYKNSYNKQLEQNNQYRNDYKLQEENISNLKQQISDKNANIDSINKEMAIKQELYDKYKSDFTESEEKIIDLNNELNSQNFLLNNINTSYNDLKDKYNEQKDANTNLTNQLKEVNISQNPDAETFFSNYAQNVNVENFTGQSPKIFINNQPFYDCQANFYSEEEGEVYKNCINDLNIVNSAIPSKYTDNNPPMFNQLYTQDYEDLNEKIVSPVCPDNYIVKDFVGLNNSNKIILCQEENENEYCIPYDTRKIVSEDIYDNLLKTSFSDCDYPDKLDSYMIKNIERSAVFKNDLSCKKWCTDNPNCLAVSIARDTDGQVKCNFYKSINNEDPRKDLISLNRFNTSLKRINNYNTNLSKTQLNDYYKKLNYGDCTELNIDEEDVQQELMSEEYCAEYGKSFYPTKMNQKECPQQTYGENKKRYQCLKNYSMDTTFDVPPLIESFSNRNNYIIILLLLILLIFLLKYKKYI